MRLNHIPHQHLYKLATLLWIGVIISLSLQDGTQSSLTSGVLTQVVGNVLTQLKIPYQITVLSFLIRKSAHFIEYAILAFLAIRSGRFYRKLTWFHVIFIIPWLDEGLQNFIPGRAGSLVDVLIDTLGILSVFLLVKLFQKLKKPVN
jgi:VanZ family protein